MAKIGIYGSAFDPITNVHLWTASTVAHRCKLDRVIFLPSSSKRKDKKLYTEDHHRWNMIRMAIKDNEKIFSRRLRNETRPLEAHNLRNIKLFQRKISK